MSRQPFKNNAKMSLFVGNISKYVDQKDIEREFRQFGDCTVDFRGKYAFIQYKSEQEAEQAKNRLQGKELQGLRINVEWSKKSGRYDENRRKRHEEQEMRRSRSRSHKKQRRQIKSHSRSKSFQRNRSSPNYKESKSHSVDSENEPPRDKALRKFLKEAKKTKKEKQKGKDKDQDKKKDKNIEEEGSQENENHQNGEKVEHDHDKQKDKEEGEKSDNQE